MLKKVFINKQEDPAQARDQGRLANLFLLGVCNEA